MFPIMQFYDLLAFKQRMTMSPFNLIPRSFSLRMWCTPVGLLTAAMTFRALHLVCTEKGLLKDMPSNLTHLNCMLTIDRPPFFDGICHERCAAANLVYLVSLLLRSDAVSRGNTLLFNGGCGGPPRIGVSSIR